VVRAPLDGFDSDDLEHSGPSGCQVAYTVMQPFQRRDNRLGSERHGCASQDCKENEEYPDRVHATIASPRPRGKPSVCQREGWREYQRPGEQQQSAHD